ncbi:MAG: hypothetical protein ACRCXL_09015 [Dermatophilaceae bacterium]
MTIGGLASLGAWVAQDASSPQLPMSTGVGPNPAAVAAVSQAGEVAQLGESGVWGELHPLRSEPSASGATVVAYLTRSGALCIGSVPATGANTPVPSSCDPIRRLPKAGLAAGITYEPAAASAGSSSAIALGIVRGEVSRVEVRSARGKSDAELAPLPAGLGTLYWADTGMSSSSADILTVERVVYSGADAVFACADIEPDCT